MSCAADWHNGYNRDARSAARSSIPSKAPAQPSAPRDWLLRASLRRGQTGWAPAPSPVDFSEHDIERAENRGHIGEQMAPADEVHRLQMREARCADLALVGLVAAVGDEIDAELALRRLDRGIDFAGRHVDAFGVELEVMDKGFHRALHLATARRRDLVVLDDDGALPLRRIQLL